MYGVSCRAVRISRFLPSIHSKPLHALSTHDVDTRVGTPTTTAVAKHPTFVRDAVPSPPFPFGHSKHGKQQASKQASETGTQRIERKGLGITNHPLRLRPVALLRGIEAVRCEDAYTSDETEQV